MNAKTGNFCYWCAAAATFLVTVGLVVSCLEHPGHEKAGAVSGDTVVSSTEIGNPALKTALGTEVGNPALIDKGADSVQQRTDPGCVEMLAERMDFGADSLQLLPGNFDAIRFMKQLP